MGILAYEGIMKIRALVLPFQVLMGPKKDLWEMLQIVERMGSNASDPDAMEITASIKDLPTVR